MKGEPQIPGRQGRFAYSINEVCAGTSLGRDAVYRAISSGQLAARKLGKRTVVTSRDLERFLHSLPKARRDSRRREQARGQREESSHR